jgi:hypothetical protein
MRNWYVVHRATKRLPPVAAALKSFLVAEGAPLIEAMTHFNRHAETHGPPPAAKKATL